MTRSPPSHIRPSLGRAVIEAAPSIIYVYDVAENRSVFQNRSLGEMLGYSPDESLALGDEAWKRLIHPDDAARFPIHRARLPSLADGESLTFEYRMRHASGGWRWLLSRDTAFRREPDGRLLQVIGSTSDITEQKRTEEALRVHEEQLRISLAAANAGTWEWDLVTDRIDWSEQVSQLFDFPPNTPLGEHLQSVHPDDRGRVAAGFDLARGAGDALDLEYRVFGGDRPIAWVSAVGRAVPDSTGRRESIRGILQDITNRKVHEHALAEIRARAAEQQRLLIAELNHRVKNTLAVVQSLTIQTRRAARSTDEFVDAFQGRIHALAAAHDLLTRGGWQGASLGEVIQQTLAPHAPTGDVERLSATGPEVRLSPNAALTLSMAVHELATNAIKYGALSNDAGRVSIRWFPRPVGSTGAPGILIEWVERDGPPVSPPARQGFGVRLLGRSLANEFDGNVSLAFAPQGLECQLHLPLSAKVAL